MAVTANQTIRAQNPSRLITGKVLGSTTLYQGTLAYFERTSGTDEGYVLGDDDGGNNNFAGIVVKEVDNSSGDSGDKDVELYTEGDFVLAGTGFTRAIVGDKAYATDNYVVTASSSSSTYIGTFVEYISTTAMRVRIDTQEPS